jgi:ABC-2 type transport system permease protein
MKFGFGERSGVTSQRDNPSVWTVTSIELLRMRNGFIAGYTVLAPVVIAVPLYVGSLFSPEAESGHMWDIFSNVILEFWGVLLPMTAALTAALSVRADEDAWRLMLSYAVPRWRFFAGKFASLAILGLVSSVVLAAVLLVGALLTGQLNTALPLVLGASFLPWTAGLATMAITLYVCVRWGMATGISLGVAGMLCGALIADKGFWYAVPFAWPMRVIVPLADIYPNGISLPPGSPLADMSVIPVAAALSLVLGTVVFLLGARHMTRKEV